MGGHINEQDETRLRKLVTWVTLTVTGIFVLGTPVIFLYLGTTSPNWQPFFKDHFRALVGVPEAVGAALILVIILRAAAGPIEFEAPFGFKFKGASGPLVLWVLCFLAIAAALWRLW